VIADARPLQSLASKGRIRKDKALSRAALAFIDTAVKIKAAPSTGWRYQTHRENPARKKACRKYATFLILKNLCLTDHPPFQW